MRAQLRGVEHLLAQREPGFGFRADVRLDGDAFRQREVRQPRFAELERQRAAPRDLDGIPQRLRECRRTAPPSPAGERRYCASVYLRGRFGSASCAPSEMQTRASCDSKSSRGEEAHVVGRDHGDAGLLAERARPWRPASRRRRARGAAARGSNDRRTAAAIRARARAHRPRGRWRSRGRRRPPAKPDSAIRPGVVCASSHSRVEQRHALFLAFEPGARDEIGDVLVAARDPCRASVSRVGAARSPRRAAGRPTPMMGLTPCFRAFAVELHHREQIVLVGDGDRRHAELRGAFDQLRECAPRCPAAKIRCAGGGG